jgi:uncharacterized membrane protein YukC
MSNKDQKGSVIGGLMTIVVYVLYLMFTITEAQNFWTHNQDSYVNNIFSIDIEETGHVDYKKLDMTIGI